METVETIQEQIMTAEESLILEAFKDFKAIVKQQKLGGELRVAIEPDRETGEPEIIFAGYNFKRSLDPIRTVYRKRKEQTRTFGGSKR